MSESAPKSTIVLDVDAQGVSVGVNAAKKELKSLGAAAQGVGESMGGAGKASEKAFDGVEKKVVATKRTTDALVNQLKNSIIDLKTAGDAASKYELRAIDKGILASVYAPYVAQLRTLQVEQAAAAASAAAAANSIAKTLPPALEKTGMTAKATAAAMRSVPAQFTDIVVSLQGGQAPLTVLLQQGGQLKDMFGGIGAAARALGSYVAGLVNPFSIAAVAVGSLAIAYMKGAAESEAFNKALILSGNQAGTTAGKLAVMAQQVSASTGATVGAAAESLAILAATSGIATAQFNKIAAVAIGMEKTTGKAVGETIKQFVELGKSPVDASIKLNESTNYLTLSVYEQIRALVEQGRTLEAGVVAQNAYADAMTRRIPELIDNLGYAEAAWKSIGSVARKAWDDFLGVGRTADPVAELSKNIAAAQAKLQMRDSEFKNAKGYDRIGAKADLADQQKVVDGLLQEQSYLQEIDRIKGRSNTLDAERKKQVEALDAFNKRGEAYLEKSVKLERALNVERVAAGQLLKDGVITAEQYGERLQKIALSFADKPKAGGGGRAPRTKTEVDESAKGVALYNDLISKGAGFTANYAEQMASLARSASLGGLSVTQVAEAAALLNAQQPGAIALVKAENEALDAALKTIEANDKLALSYEEARIAAASYIDTINKQAAREVAGAGRGSKFRENQRGLNAIEDKLTEKQGTLGGELRTGKIDKDQYDKYLALANDTYQKELDAYSKSRAAMTEVQGSWALGAQEAMQNYADSSSDVFAQIDDLVGSSLKGMEDALVQFVTTGKLSFTDLANSIVSDITRIIIKQQISNAMGLGGSGSGGDFMGSIVSSALGSISGAFSNATGDFSAFAAITGGNGRAIGGPVSAGQMYRVNEKGPELLNVAGKQFLMMGSESGKVTANSGAGSANTVNLVVNQSFAPNTSRATTMQAASDARRQLEYAGRNL